MKAKQYILIFFLICCSISCHSQQKDSLTPDSLKIEINKWLSPYRDEQKQELTDWYEQVLNSPKTGYDHPLYKHLQKFINQHKSQYLQLRLASLEQYPKAPELLPGYHPLQLSLITKDSAELMERLNIMQNIASIRTLDVGDTRTVLSMLVSNLFEYFQKEKEIPMYEIARKLGAGNLMYVDNKSKHSATITLINRIYAIRYNWTPETNLIKNLQLWEYTEDKQPPGWLSNYGFKAKTPQNKLFSKLIAFRWSLYDKVYNNTSSSSKETDLVQEFMDAHKKEFINVRKLIVSTYPQGDKGWQKNYEKMDQNFVSELCQSIGLEKENSVFHPAPDIELFSYSLPEALFGRFNNYLILQLEDLNKKNAMTMWLTGPNLNSRSVATNIWEITGFIGNYALQYTWDIEKNTISNISCWQKPEK